MVLELKNVTKKFGGLIAVNDVSFGMEEGQVLGLIGPNGSGKTTCFNLITGVHSITSGEILYDGKIINGHSPHEIAKMGIARTFQINSVFPSLSALENVMAAHYCRLKANILTGLFGLGKIAKEEAKAWEHSRELLEFVGLQDFQDATAKMLTSANQRRLMVAIAMATDPKVLLLDEPCAGMNHDEQMEVIQLIKKVSNHGLPVLLVEHHMKMIMQVCDRIVVLNLGKKIADGTPKEIQNNADVINAYLGKGGQNAESN